MTGSELYFLITEFLETLWWDITHIADTNLLSLTFRLLLFFIIARILYALISSLIRSVWQFLRNLVRKTFSFLLSPFRRWKQRHARKRREQESWERERVWKQEQEEREKKEALEAEKKKKQLDEILKKLDG